MYTWQHSVLICCISVISFVCGCLVTYDPMYWWVAAPVAIAIGYTTGRDVK